MLPGTVKVLIALQLSLSLISIPSGALLLYSPGGEAIGAQTILPRITEAVPFLHDFAPVGAFLLLAYGVLPLALAAGLWTKRRWAWALTLVLGFTEVVWILAELLLFYGLGFIVFYPIIMGMGIATAAICSLPRVRTFYARPPALR